MTKALVSHLLYWRSLSKKYPLHHNHTQSKKFSSEFRKLHVKDYTIVLKSDKNKVPCCLRVAFLAYELHLYLHIFIYIFYPHILFFGICQVLKFRILCIQNSNVYCWQTMIKTMCLEVFKVSSKLCVNVKLESS